jgi:3-methyladenine DNA glycosylase AlkD
VRVALSDTSALSAKLRRALRAVANPANAPAMQAYMKTTTPFLGCSATPMRAACKETFFDLELDDARAWRDAVLGLWRGAKYREERYAAIELCAHRCSRAFRDALDAVPTYEEMIVTGAWWDLVDGIATHRIGDVLRAHPKEMKRTLRAWAKGDEIWKRRTAIIAQTRFKRDTDVDLLSDCIAPSIDRKEFWLRKAIGWALREYGKANGAWVLAYVKAHPELSGLSKREALKYARS